MNSGAKLILIKTVHTLIWMVLVALIVFVLWSGITSRISVYSWFAVASILTEGLILAIFKGNCPLTIMARKYSDSSSENFDIFLPSWLAKYNKMIFGTLFCIGVILMMLKG